MIRLGRLALRASPDNTSTEIYFSDHLTFHAVEKCERSERINLDNTLSFTVKMRQYRERFQSNVVRILEDSVIELDGDWFDIATITKEQASDGIRRYHVECEHISYRLNKPEYDYRGFGYTGPPAEIIDRLMTGTGISEGSGLAPGTDFSSGTVEFTEPVTFYVLPVKDRVVTRRALLMALVHQLGGEVAFHRNKISILRRRGKTEPVTLQEGRDVLIVSETTDNRERDENDNPRKYYDCDILNKGRLALGDEIRIQMPGMWIDEQLRVYGLSADPYNPRRATVEIGNISYALENDIVRIERAISDSERTMLGLGLQIYDEFPTPEEDANIPYGTTIGVLDKAVTRREWIAVPEIWHKRERI